MSKPQTDAKKAAQAAKQQAAKQEAAKKDATGTVTIGCRLPNGLSIPLTGGGMLHLRGANDPRAMLQGEHGLTFGVPEAQWEEVQTLYSSAKWFTSLICASKAARVEAEAEERGAVDVGFNGVDPDAPGAKLEPAA